jgi:protein-tyrosine-phosphatase
MAEALLVHEGLGRFEVASAGATPAMEVDPMTFEVLDELGVDWRAHRPKSYDAVQNVEWDIVLRASRLRVNQLVVATTTDSTTD